MSKAANTELAVNPRSLLGKKVKQLRRQGLVPANIYGRDVQSTAIQLPVDELKHVLRTAGRNEIVYLRLDAQDPRPTFIRTVQRNAVNDAILHVDFHQISLKEKVRLEVPLHLAGEAPAVSTYGGTLLHSLDFITVEGLPTDIPSHIEVDVSVLEQMDQSLHVRDLPVPANLNVLTDPELVVAKVAPPAVERAEEVVPEEEAVPAAEEAAPGAPPPKSEE